MLRPKVQTLTLSYTALDQKGTRFRWYTFSTETQLVKPLPFYIPLASLGKVPLSGGASLYFLLYWDTPYGSWNQHSRIESERLYFETFAGTQVRTLKVAKLLFIH